MNEMPDLNARLQAAVRSEAVPPYLEARIKARIRASESPRRWVVRLVPVIIATAICAGAGIAYELGHLRLTVQSQQSYIASVSNRVATLMRVGLGDHIHCSVFRKYPKNPPRLNSLWRRWGRNMQA